MAKPATDAHAAPPGSNLLAVLRDVLETSATPWLCLTSSWAVSSANPAFEALVGRAARRLVGAGPPYPFWAEPDPARLASAGRWRATTFVDGRDEPVAVEVSVQPVLVARARPAAFVLRARPRRRDGRTDESAWAVERLRRLETTLARVRHELDAVGGAHPAPRADDAMLPNLSARERQVLDALLHGRRVADVARDMGIAQNTVRNHVKAIFRKVGVRSQTELLVRLRPVVDEG